MATAGGRKSRSLMDRLVEEPYAFDFFQAVRLLERMALERARTRAGATEIYVGEDQFDHEAVRCRSQPSLSFPSSPIVRIRPADADEKTETLAEMAVTFMGT